MEAGECALGVAAVVEETLNYGVDDVDMADADSNTEQILAAEVSAAAGRAGAGGGQAEKAGPEGKKKRRRRKKKKKNKARQDGPPIDIADVDRFVLNTCKRLKEKKWYLVSNAVDCFGATAVSDLVREVEAIQKCGGKTTADGSRLRAGGGILWNILKSREPKAYKEIMARGKQFEKFFSYIKPPIRRNKDGNSQGSALIDDEIESEQQKEILDDPEQLDSVEKTPASDNKAQRKPLADRIRVPVAYGDLFEEGEIHEGEPLEEFRRLRLVESCEAQRNGT